jgi:chromosome segregation ATPase
MPYKCFVESSILFASNNVVLLQAELTVQERMKHSEVLRAQEELQSVTKEKDRLVKRVKKLENVLKVVQFTIPSLEAQKEQQQHNCRRAEDSIRKLQEVCRTTQLTIIHFFNVTFTTVPAR